jgi:DNA-directed RNA polymerase subunit RPC12/RpoP
MPKVHSPAAGQTYGEFDMDNIPYKCLDCGSDFFVFALREEDNADIYYCPYCGAEMDDELDIEGLEEE